MVSLSSPSALLAAALLLGGCRQQEQRQPAPGIDQSRQAAPALASFAGSGRDRLCLAPDGSRAGFVTYGAGDANCTVRGSLGPGGALKPAGDDKCRISLARSDGTVTLGPVSAECAYYCGPGASFAGKTFRTTPQPEPVADLVGDPLC